MEEKDRRGDGFRWKNLHVRKGKGGYAQERGKIKKNKTRNASTNHEKRHSGSDSLLTSKKDTGPTA